MARMHQLNKAGQPRCEADHLSSRYVSDVTPVSPYPTPHAFLLSSHVST